MFCRCFWPLLLLKGFGLAHCTAVETPYSRSADDVPEEDYRMARLRIQRTHDHRRIFGEVFPPSDVDFIERFIRERERQMNRVHSGRDIQAINYLDFLLGDDLNGPAFKRFLPGFGARTRGTVSRKGVSDTSLRYEQRYRNRSFMCRQRRKRSVGDVVVPQTHEGTTKTTTGRSDSQGTVLRLHINGPTVVYGTGATKARFRREGGLLNSSSVERRNSEAFPAEDDAEEKREDEDRGAS